jgi:7-cyano-7-deazaguanine tRNA-ribosyltransferase
VIRRNSEASTFAFEVKETDLLGRIGLVTVNGRQFETPCLLPVIHPVKQLISPQEMFDLGFGCLMTNSFILYHRRREEAIQQGVHRLLGFSGAMMTDSGGYQVLEYGSADISPLEIAEFQTQIGSDLAVPLDKPTGSVGSKAYARETVITSLRSAELAIKGFGSGSTVWLGPVQGGVFKDLVRLCTK